MATEIAAMPELMSKIDLSSPCPGQESEEDNVEIIIKPKRKDTVCSETSVSSCEEADVDQGVVSNKDESDTSETDQQQAFFDASDKLGGFDPSLRRDSGFEENKKNKLTAKDSGNSETTGNEAEEENFVVPDEELTKKIVDQVEFYFSDASITKDAFLLKHVRRNKEGFVSLKLISCFKRVKHLTKDWRQVAYAIKNASQELEVNEAETKVRRKAPLPETDETTPSRTVVAYNLPAPPLGADGQPQAPSIESVAEIFKKFGEIALVRILRPGNPIPGDVKQFLGKHPEIGNCICALVEFEKTEYAKKAVVEMAQDEAENWRGVKVLELALKPKREKAPKKNKGDERRRSETSQLSGSEREELEQLRRRHQRRRGSRVEVLRRDSYTWGDSSGISGSESDGSMLNLAGAPYMPPRRYSYVSTPSSAGSMSPGSPCCTPHHRGAPCYCFNRNRATPFDFAPNGGSPVSPMLTPGMHHMSPPVAPYYHAQQQRGSFDDGRSWRSNKPAHQVYLAPAMVPGHHAPLSRRHSDAATGLTVPDNVLRLPRGPDPSAGRGFRASQFAHWAQPNRFQQKGRSGSVPTVVFTRYAQQPQQYMPQDQQAMEMSMHAMEQPMHMEQPQYIYQPPMQMTQPPPHHEPRIPNPITIEAPPAVEPPQQVEEVPLPAEPLSVIPSTETIPEIPAAEAAATADETGGN